MMRPNGVEKQVRPSGWQPGANTVAYYPLDTDFNDASGNSRNLTNTNATITTLNGVACASYDGSSYSEYSGYSITRDARTISVWLNANSISNGVCVQIAKYDTSFMGSLAVALYSSYILIADSGTINIDPYTGQTGIWYHVVGTQEGNTVKGYINGTLIGTSTSRPTYDYAPDGWMIGSQDNSNHTVMYNGYLSEVILEDKVRTAQEISDYFDQTKSNYGIS